MKHKENGYYLLTTDIEELEQRYSKLYKQLQNDFENKETTKQQLDRMCEVLLKTFNHEVEQLNDLRYAEYKKQQAKIKAKNDEQIPWRRCWLWRLLGQPLTNRAQDIIEEEAALEADKLFTSEEKKLDELASKLYGENKKPLSKRRRKRALKKYLKYKRLLNLNEEAAIERFEVALDKASENVNPLNEPAEPKEPATVKKFTTEEVEQLLRDSAEELKLKNFDELVSKIKNRIYLPESEQNPAENVAELKPGETGKPAEVKPESAEQATEPPEPPARKPRKNKQQLGVEPL